MTLLEMSIMGAVMILAVCAVRAAALNRLPRRIFVLLWILCAVRLVVPWQIPSPVSVYNLLKLQADASVEATGQTAAATAVMPLPGPALQDAVTAESASADGAAVDAANAVWWVGLTICAGIAVFLYIRWWTRFAESLPVETRAVETFVKEHPLRRPLAVRSSAYIRAPLTYGVLRPVILLPRSMDLTDKKQLEYILMHEYMHVRHLDALLKLVLAAVVCVHWFNPVVWLMYVLAARDMELACDESVVARCGGRADYARMLIRLESRKLMQFVPGMNGSAGAARERIKSIMKLKKRSVLALVAAGALVAGVSTAFATSASEMQGDSGWSDTVIQETFAAEDAAGSASCAVSGAEIEWWTAEEYEAWLETEKDALQSILGSKSWTPSEGEFEWTQDKIDETIEKYEQILQDIRAGARVSKSVDGDASVMIVQESSAQESGTEQGDYIDAELFEEYAAFGLTMSPNGPLYEGEKVAYFEDTVEIEPDMYLSKTTYFSEDGTACVRTVRRATQNPDGSTDPFGQLIGLERIPKDEARALIRNIQTGEVIAVEDTMTPEGTTLYQAVEPEREVVVEDEITAADLAPYQALGLEYEVLPNGLFLMRYEGKDVHSLYDPVTGTWFASNMHGSNLGPDRVDLEAVYQDGRIASLKVLPEQHGEAACAGGSAAAESTTFEQKFAAYKPFGLTSEKVQTSLGGTRYNLFLDGDPVNHFANVAPDGSVFTYDSAEQVPNGLKVHVAYKGSRPVRIDKD